MAPLLKKSKIKTPAAQPAASAQAREGFSYTKRYLQETNKFEKALHDAGFRWVHAYSLGQGLITGELSAAGKHLILLEKGDLEAENKDHAWIKPLDKVQLLDTTNSGQKQLCIRAKGTYILRGVADSEYYEAHACLSPEFAHELVVDDCLRFLMGDGKPAAKATVADLLKRTTLERTTKKRAVTVRVFVPNADTSQVSKAIRDWFVGEWSRENYNKRRVAAKTLEREDIKDLFRSDSDDGDDEDASATDKGQDQGTGSTKDSAEGEDGEDMDEQSDYVEEDKE